MDNQQIPLNPSQSYYDIYSELYSLRQVLIIMERYKMPIEEDILELESITSEPRKIELLELAPIKKEFV